MIGVGLKLFCTFIFMKRMTQGKAIISVISVTLFFFILTGFDLRILVAGLKGLLFWIIWPLAFMLLALIFVSLKNLAKKIWNKFKQY